MATFDFSGLLPQFKGSITSAQLRNRYNDIKTYLNTLNPGGYTFPSGGSQYQALLLGSGTAFTFNHILRSNVALSHDAGNGSAGQVLQSDGDGTTSWVSIANQQEWSDQATGFTSADGGRYTCNAGITITLHSPSDNDEFWFRPNIGQDLTSSAITIARAGSEEVANAAENYTANINAIYHCVSDGTDWDIAVYPIGRGV